MIPKTAERFRKAPDTTHNTFARRRRKVAVLRQNIETTQRILTPMESLLKNWKTSLAGIVGIVAIIISTWLPEYQVEFDKAIVILMGLGLLRARDPKIEVTGPPSYLSKVLLAMLTLCCLSLISCSTAPSGAKTFLGITGEGWIKGGKAAAISAAPVLLEERAKAGAKQPVKKIQPD